MVKALLAGTKTQTRRVVKESIHGPGSWGPTWVWVIEFGRVEPVAGGEAS